MGIEDTPILKGIDLRIPKGEIHAIMGGNGSGKTTTANVIMGTQLTMSKRRNPFGWRKSTGNGFARLEKGFSCLSNIHNQSQATSG